MGTSDYFLRGGSIGRGRLRILSRVMRPTTLYLLRRAGLADEAEVDRTCHYLPHERNRAKAPLFYDASLDRPARR